MAAGLGMALCMAAQPCTAQAQTAVDTRMERDTVTARSRPGFEAVGIALGSFRLAPALTAESTVTDNLYARSDTRAHDISLSLRPRVSLQSQWRSHALNLSAGGAIDRFAAHPSENTARFDLATDGRIDLSGMTRLTADGSFARKIEARGTTGDTLFGAKPIAYTQLSTGLVLEQDFVRTKIALGARYERFRYADRRLGAASIDLAARNYETLSGNLRIAQGLTPGVAAFVSIDGNRSRYPVPTPGGSRNSQGYGVIAGVAFGLNRLLQGEVGAGYLRQDFDNPLYPRISGLNYRTQLRWSPTQLTTITVAAGKSVQRSPIANIAGIEQQDFSIRADHELLRNLILRPGLAASISSYRGSPRRDHTLAAQFSAVWLLNERVEVNGTLGHALGRSSELASRAREYDQNRATVGVTFRL